MTAQESEEREKPGPRSGEGWGKPSRLKKSVRKIEDLLKYKQQKQENRDKNQPKTR